MMPKFHQVVSPSRPGYIEQTTISDPDRPEAPLLIFSFFLALTMKRQGGNLTAIFCWVQP